jgi:hypothetical protein
MLLKIFRSTLFTSFLAAQLPLSVTAIPGSGTSHSGATGSRTTATAATADTVQYEIPFEYADGHMLVIHGGIGRHKNLEFVVDFGTTYTLLDREYAAAEPAGQTMEITHFSSAIQSTNVVVSELQLGSMVIKDFHSYLLDLSQIPGVPQGIAGVIGLDVLQRQNVTIDFVEKRILLASHVGGEHQAPLQKCEVGFAVDASWKGLPVKLALSTGVEVVTLDQDRVRAKPIKLNGLKQSTLSSNFTVTPVSVFETKELRLGNMQLKGPGVLRKMSWPYPSDELDGFLPLLALNADRVSIDFERNILFWEGTKLASEKAHVAMGEPRQVQRR